MVTYTIHNSVTDACIRFISSALLATPLHLYLLYRENCNVSKCVTEPARPVEWGHALWPPHADYKIYAPPDVLTNLGRESIYNVFISLAKWNR